MPKKIDVIYHCASIVGVSKYMSNTIELIENNFYGAKKAIQIALKQNSKIIFLVQVRYMEKTINFHGMKILIEF